METFGSRLKKARNALSIDQKELARLLGRENQSIISNWENDRAKPSADDLVRLADVLKVSIDYLMRNEVTPYFVVEEPRGFYGADRTERYTRLLEQENENLREENKQIKSQIQALLQGQKTH